MNGKVYIGQSVDIHRRFREHKCYSTSKHLRNAFRLYGIEQFQFEIIEELDASELVERERYWIQYYNSTDPEFGYNSTDGGESSCGWHHSEETKAELSRKSKQRTSDPSYVSPTLDTKVIHKGDVTTRCKISELEDRLADGWELGMSEKSKRQGALNRTGAKNGVYGKGYLFTGDKNHFYGKHHSAETIQSIKDHMPYNAQFAGQHHSEETKAKMRGPRPSVAGANNPNYGKRGELSHMQGRKGIHKGDVEKRVPAKDLEAYLADGWILGLSDKRKKGCIKAGKASMSKRLANSKDRSEFASTKGRKLISRDGIKKFVPLEELDTYLSDGWVLGYPHE